MYFCFTLNDGSALGFRNRDDGEQHVKPLELQPMTVNHDSYLAFDLPCFGFKPLLLHLKYTNYRVANVHEQASPICNDL